jgi:hypothetical protein
MLVCGTSEALVFEVTCLVRRWQVELHIPVFMDASLQVFCAGELSKELLSSIATKVVYAGDMTLHIRNSYTGSRQDLATCQYN